jgi:hypothetical protein
MAKVRDLWVGLAVAAALVLPLWFLSAALATKFGLLDWRTGFLLMTLQVGPLLLLGVFAFAFLGLLLAFIVAPRRGRIAALMALLVPAAGLGYAGWVRQQAQAVPPIHDVSTDLVNPPTFSTEAVVARAKISGGNDLDLIGARIPNDPRFGAMAGASVLEAHRAAYGDLKSLVTDAPAFDTFQVALDTAEQQRGWVVVSQDPRTGMIEARATSFWFGFVDDIAIRVRELPDGSGTAVDVRSASRVGVSDLGANAARVRSYLKDLNGRLGEAATGG